MLHYRDRKKQIHIITLDNVLARDICERLTDYPDTASANLILPRDYAPEAILKSARDTTASKILIIDVRTQTKPRLQQAHSDIIRFNRPDLNNYCHCALIGDGPSTFLLENHGVNAFQKYLADLRIDYSPAVFFANPFIYYTQDELLERAMYHDNALPEKIPQRLEKFFKKDIPIKTVYEFFRAAGETGEEKLKKTKTRKKKLKDIYLKMIAQDFPAEKERLESALAKQGCDFHGESLKLNIYPFYFEDWIKDLLNFAPFSKL